MVNSRTIDEIERGKEKENLKKLEAVFFISARFLSVQELVSLTDFNSVEIEDLIEKLKGKYDRMDSAIEIVRKNDLFKMDVRKKYIDLINKIATGSSEFTKAEQETLSIIAFKQPIRQSVVVKIRGNKSYDHIKRFCDVGLVKKKKAGHTYELSLTDDFYDYFKIKSEDDA